VTFVPLKGCNVLATVGESEEEGEGGRLAIEEVIPVTSHFCIKRKKNPDQRTRGNSDI